MASLDDIHKDLGRLLSSMETTNQQVSALFNKHDKMSEEVIELRGATKLMAATLTEVKTAVGANTTRITATEKKQDEYENKGKGLLVGLTLLGGGGGIAGFWSSLKGLFS